MPARKNRPSSARAHVTRGRQYRFFASWTRWHIGSSTDHPHNRSARLRIFACLGPNRESHHSASRAVMSVVRMSMRRALSTLLGAVRTKLWEVAIHLLLMITRQPLKVLAF